MRLKDKNSRTDPLFDSELREISGIRLARGLDKKPKARARIQRGVIKHSLWAKIKEDLENAKMD